MTRRPPVFELLLSVAFASAVAAGSSAQPIPVRELLRECECLAPDMPRELLDQRASNHAVTKGGEGFALAYWTSLEPETKPLLHVIAGQAGGRAWTHRSIPVEERARRPLVNVERTRGLIIISTDVGVDSQAMVVLNNALEHRGTIYGELKDVWPNGWLSYRRDRDDEPQHVSVDVFDPASRIEKRLYPAETAVTAGATRGLSAFDWPQNAMAFVVRHQPPPRVSMVVCEALDRIQAASCRDTPIASWRALFPGVADDELPARAAARPRLVQH